MWEEVTHTCTLTPDSCILFKLHVEIREAAAVTVFDPSALEQ